jgi:flagellar hook-length control protein FliK
MPRLREAFAQQGLQLDDVEVSLDSRQSGGRDTLFGQGNQEQSHGRRFGQGPVAPEVVVEHERQAALSGMSGGQGISVHI